MYISINQSSKLNYATPSLLMYMYYLWLIIAVVIHLGFPNVSLVSTYIDKQNL